MKLSAAIIKGCEIRPRQCFEQLFGPRRSACVLGALALGLGREKEISDLEPHELHRNLDLALWTNLHEANDSRHFSREFLAYCLAEEGL